jgi:hypothetical protein
MESKKAGGELRWEESSTGIVQVDKSMRPSMTSSARKENQQHAAYLRPADRGRSFASHCAPSAFLKLFLSHDQWNNLNLHLTLNHNLRRPHLFSTRNRLPSFLK